MFLVRAFVVWQGCYCRTGSGERGKTVEGEMGGGGGTGRGHGLVVNEFFHLASIPLPCSCVCVLTNVVI